MQAHLPQFEAANATVLAVSADEPDQIAALAKGKGITFPLLADPKLKVIDAYGLRHKGASIHGTDIARPAIFIIDRAGRIRWHRLTDNWRVRSRPAEILRRLAALTKSG